MKLHVEIDKKELKKLVIAAISEQIGNMGFDPEFVQIETKSQQNYRSEWEEADFRAILDVNT